MSQINYEQNTNVSNSKKSLVIYYSRSGNTKQIANYIREKTELKNKDYSEYYKI